MIEADFTRAVHKKLPQTVWAWKICDPYMGGIPDAYYRHRNTGKALWVEYKYIKSLPSRDNTRIIPNLSALQLNLLNETVESGQQAVVIVGYANTGVVFTQQEWVEGITKVDFEQRLKPYSALAEHIEALIT